MTKNEFVKYRYENYLKDVEQLLVIFHRDDMTYERFQELVEYARRFLADRRITSLPPGIRGES